jgi:hypothetical protein
LCKSNFFCYFQLHPYTYVVIFSPQKRGFWSFMPFFVQHSLLLLIRWLIWLLTTRQFVITKNNSVVSQCSQSQLLIWDRTIQILNLISHGKTISIVDWKLDDTDLLQRPIVTATNPVPCYFITFPCLNILFIRTPLFVM